MEKITKEEFKTLILDGIATDIFIAERAYCMFKTIGQMGEAIDAIGYQEFFKCTQAAFKDQFLLATARLFDSPSKRNKTRCIPGVIQFISKNATRLPDIVEKYNLILVLEEIGFNKVQLDRFRKNGNNPEMTMAIVKHFSHLLESPEKKRLLDRLKEIRDKKLAHNEITSTTPHGLAETLEIVTFKDLAGLLEISKHFIGTIGWAYMNTVFLHDGRYHLSDDAQRPIYSLTRMIDRMQNLKT